MTDLFCTLCIQTNEYTVILVVTVQKVKEVITRNWEVSSDDSDEDDEDIKNIDNDTNKVNSSGNDHKQASKSKSEQKNEDSKNASSEEDEEAEELSEENCFARRLLALITPLQKFLTGETIARYVFVLGDPFNSDVLVEGFIDTVLCNPNTFELSICLRKTRSKSYLPNIAMRQPHFMQAMVYKALLNDLIAGKLNLVTFVKWRRLDLNKELDDEEVIKKINALGLSARTLKDLFEVAQEKLKYFAPVRDIRVSYASQIDLKHLGTFNADNGDRWFRETYQHLISFWRKERTVKEMDIEEVVKCKTCTYFKYCKWRYEGPDPKKRHRQTFEEIQMAQKQHYKTGNDWKLQNSYKNPRQQATEAESSKQDDRLAVNNWYKKDQVGNDDQRRGNNTSFHNYKSSDRETWRSGNNDKRNQQIKSFRSNQPVCNCSWRQKHHNENCEWRKQNIN